MRNKKRMLFCIVLVCAIMCCVDWTGMSKSVTVMATDIANLEEKKRFSSDKQVQENADTEKARMLSEQEAAQKAARIQAEQEVAQEAARIQEEKEAAVHRETKAASTKEEELLSALIYCEAGGEPYEGQVAVGAVVMNRVKSSAFPDTITQVIYQSGQFGPAITGKLERVLINGEITASCVQAAREAIGGRSPVGGALYFGDGQEFGQKIGGHWFHS